MALAPWFRAGTPCQNARPSRRCAIDTQDYLALVRGDRRGPIASLARGGLCVAAGLFRVGAALRSSGYDAGLFPVHQASVPVVSVGNLTTGGTGKTPLVIWLTRRLMLRGLKTAVLARGYGAAKDGDLNDELTLIGEEVPGVAIYPGADRVARAVGAHHDGCEVLVLDDGFQHRRLARDLDIVLLDATDPWGTPGRWVLPRGLLREPPAALRRADAVVLSRVELAGSTALKELEEEVRRLGFEGPILRMEIRPARVAVLARAEGSDGPSTEPLDFLQGLPVLAVCGIGNPSAYAATLASLGARTSQLVALPDHHTFRQGDVVALEELAGRRAVGSVCVTEKDAVKLVDLLSCGPRRANWLALGVDAVVEPEGPIEELLDGVAATARDAKTPASPPDEEPTTE